MTPRVLHVFPDSAVDPTQKHLGSTKDFRGRTQWFHDRRVPFDELVHERSAPALDAALRGVALEDYDAVVIEFALSVWTTRQLRRRNPRLRILVRSGNAELLHRRDWIRGMGPTPASAKLAVRTVANVAAEAAAARGSDAILAISPWEQEHYWPKLRPRMVRWLPYYVPDEYLEEFTAAGGAREQLCVCLTSTKRNPLIVDSVRGLSRALEHLPSASDWRFAVTGLVEPELAPDPRVEWLGLLDSPAQLLRGSRCVALLSDLGFGFKTKLLEAVVAGNWVLVTPGLHARMPRDLDPWTLRVDLNRPDALERALETAAGPLPEGDPNALLRERHHALLDELLLGEPAQPKNGTQGL